MALPQYGTHRQSMRVVEQSGAPSSWSPIVPDEEQDLLKHEPTDAERARTVLGNNRCASLSVAVGKGHAAPVGFSVPYAVDDSGVPFASVRAGIEKSLQLCADEQVCLNVSETPLTAAHSGSPGGVTVLAVAAPLCPGSELDQLLPMFVRTQPAETSAIKRGAAKLYRLLPSVILIASGTGDVVKVEIKDYRAAASDPLAAVAPGLLAHLASDENGSLVLLCRAFGGLHATKSASLTALDQYGMDLLAVTAKSTETVRIPFSHTVASAEDVRRELTAMTRGARFKLGTG